MHLSYREGSYIQILQSAKLTTGPMPQASRFDAGPVALSRPLA